MMPEVVEGFTIKEEGFKIGDKVVDSTSGIELKVTSFTKNQMYGHSAIGVISLNTYSQIQEKSKGKSEISYHLKK